MRGFRPGAVTPGQLRTFVALARSGSVQGAARALGVTSPAVSAALPSLPDELGVVARPDLPGLPLHRPWHLLVRTAPSPAARLFVRHVRTTPGWHSPRNSPLRGSPIPRIPA